MPVKFCAECGNNAGSFTLEKDWLNLVHAFGFNKNRNVCAPCFKRAIINRVNNWPGAIPGEKKQAIGALKGKGATEGEDFYFNERGQYVITAWSHLRRGSCCGNNCLHCPYDHENVPR